MNGSLKMQRYMREHLHLYVYVSVLFVMGVVFGAVMANALSLEQREEIARHLGSFFHMVNDGNFLEPEMTFRQTAGMHMKWILLIWIFGLSVVGMPLILVLDFLKGVLVGFTVGYLIGHLSWNGLMFALVAVAPQNLFIIPALIITSVTAIAFSVQLVKQRFLQKKGSVYHPFMRYSLLTLSMAVLLLGVSAFEAFLSPVMMKWVTPMLVDVS